MLTNSGFMYHCLNLAKDALHPEYNKFSRLKLFKTKILLNV